MWFKTCLLALLLTGLVAADAREDYDQLKDKIRQQRRVLNEYHSRKDYAEAARLKNQVKGLLDEALELGKKAPEVSQASLWNYHSSNLKDLGYFELALTAMENYLKSPLLDRNGFRDGWRKKAQIYRQTGDLESGGKAFERALTYAEKPQDQFGLRRELVNLGLKTSNREACDAQLQKMRELLPTLETDRQLKSEIDLVTLGGRVYRQFGESQLAREAKKREMTLRKQLLERELENFEAHYPVYDEVMTQR